MSEMILHELKIKENKKGVARERVDNGNKLGIKKPQI